MNMRKRQQETTQKAILDALGEVVADSGAVEFSIQNVADRAGVSHRTVYNHFPTRTALNDAFAQHAEDQLGAHYPGPRPPEEDTTLEELPEIVAEAYRAFAQVERPTRAYVMLMIASRSPAKLTRKRTKRLEQAVESELGPLPKGVSRQVAAAMRIFMSTTGWHVMTEHLKLSTEEAAGVASWMVEMVIDQVRKGNLPKARGKS
jgi:AcrR family transcriptional regulator